MIYMSRDPRSVYCSVKLRDIKNGRKITDIDSFSFSYRQSVKMVGEYLGGDASGKFLTVKYEDLVRMPEATVARVIGFLHISGSTSLRVPTKSDGFHRWGGNAQSGEKVFHISDQNIDRWKGMLGVKEVKLLESLLREEMEHLGYEAKYDGRRSLRYYLCASKNVIRSYRFGVKYKHQGSRN